MLVLMKFIRLLLAGRSGEIRDVLIDTSGVLLGIGLCYLAYHSYIKHFEKQRKLPA